jgi:SAM-dependent methyltransferase
LNGSRQQGPASAPSPFVVEWLSGVPTGGIILDVACGAGRHLRHALARGHRVTGIDRDTSGLADLRDRAGATIIAADLETADGFPLTGLQFDGVIVANYLWRPILPDIVAAVGPSGLLIYETFAVGNERHGRPSNPHFLLRPNELLEHVGPHLAVIRFETVTLTVGHARIVQRIVAVGPEHRWVSAPPPSDCE